MKNRNRILLSWLLFVNCSTMVEVNNHFNEGHLVFDFLGVGSLGRKVDNPFCGSFVLLVLVFIP